MNDAKAISNDVTAGCSAIEQPPTAMPGAVLYPVWRRTSVAVIALAGAGLAIRAGLAGIGAATDTIPHSGADPVTG